MTDETKSGTGILRIKYKENPFIEGSVFQVPMKTKSETLETAGPLAIVSQDGEILNTAEIRRKTVVDSERFVKLFVAHLDAFFELKPGTIKLMTALIDELSNARYMNGDTIYLNYARVAEYFGKKGVKAPSRPTFFSAMAELVEKGFVAPSVDVNLWFINPAIFFNGDRIRFVTELRKKRVSHREELEAKGQRALELDIED